MKMKRFISAIAAIAMLSASLVSVSAADVIETKVDSSLGMDVTVLSAHPEEADLAARNPEVKIDVESIAKENVAAAVGNPIWAMQNSANDVYKVTATFTNIGDLVAGYDTSFNRVTAGLYGMEAQILGIAEKGLDIKAISFDTTQGGSGQKIDMVENTNDDQLLFRWTTTSSTNIYPEFLSSDMNAKIVEDPTFAFYGYIAVAAGTQIEFTADDIYTQFLYIYGVDTVKNLNVKKPASITFGTPAQEPDEPGDDEGDEDITISDRFTLENLGYAWDVTINNYDSNKTYTATFKAPGESDKVHDLSFTVEADNGTIAFAALLKTTKANVELAIAKN